MRWYILVLLMLAPFASAEGHMKLLAVKETDNGYVGSTADLYLTIEPGTGKVYLETYPLLKFDTQMSTRYAKEIACNYIDSDCENDFFYTINADSVIVGGPSAGAAIAALTIAELKGIKLDDSITITGTINSGGFIGPVGGVKEKVEAAADNGVKTVMIPFGENIVVDDENSTSTNVSVGINDSIDLVEYGKERGVEVVEVSDLGDVIYVFTGEEKKTYDLVIDDKYTETMRLLSIDLCNRSRKLSMLIDGMDITNDSMPLHDSALNLSSKGYISQEIGDYYSSASYCFGANVRFSNLYAILRNLSVSEVRRKAIEAKKRMDELDSQITEREKETITDLEAYMIVKERLIDADKYFDDVFELNYTSDSYYDLAYATERVYSAYAWYNFFDGRGRKLNLDKDSIKESCVKKIAEAQERLQYVKSIVPLEFSDTSTQLELASGDLENGDYELCLFKASKAKAETNTFLIAMSLGPDNVDNALSQNFRLIENNIGKQYSKGLFPVLGYSYLEYAKSLNVSDKYSSLLYSEYALELTNLDVYFKTKKNGSLRVNWDYVKIFLLGLIVGFILRSFLRFGRNPSRTFKKNALPGKKR